MRILPFTLAALGLAQSCASVFPKLDLATLPTAKEHPGAKFVVLLDEDTVVFSAGEGGKAQAVLTERRRIKLLKPYTVPPVALFYDTEFTDVVSMRARSILPDGTEKELDTSKAYDRPANLGSFELFSNTRLRTVAAPVLPAGAIFESVVVSKRRDVEPWVLQHGFGESEPVVDSRVVVELPSDWQVKWTLTAHDATPSLQPSEVVDGAIKRVTFVKQAIAGVIGETSGPSVWLVQPHLALRLDRWLENGVAKQAPESPEALSRSLWARYQEKKVVTPEMTEAVREALRGVPDEPEAKARALYEYACRRVQYCAVEVGYGGWIPHSSKEVHEKRWGDCKDKATYLQALLEVAGIESSPTTIYNHDGWPRPFVMPSFGANFNHAILAVRLPSGTVYADPTTRAVPFGKLPWGDSGATVLELTKDGAALKTTPESPPEDNGERQRYQLALDAGGGATGHFSFEAWGNNAAPARGFALNGTGKLERWAQRELALKNAHLKQARFDESADFALKTSFSGEVGARGVISRGVGPTGLFRVSDVFAEVVPQLGDDRTAPFAWRWISIEEDELVLALPPGTSVSHLPADREVDSDFGTVRLAWQQGPGTLTVKRAVKLKKRVIELKELASARKWVREVRATELEPAVLRFGGTR